MGQAGAQRRVSSASIVMRQPGAQGFSKMLLGQGDNPIQTFTPEGPDEPFAERIRLWAPNRCFDDCKAQAR